MDDTEIVVSVGMNEVFGMTTSDEVVGGTTTEGMVGRITTDGFGISIAALVNVISSNIMCSHLYVCGATYVHTHPVYSSWFLVGSHK